jgi:hypothetical protein
LSVIEVGLDDIVAAEARLDGSLLMPTTPSTRNEGILLRKSPFFSSAMADVKMLLAYARGRLLETAKTLPRDRKDWYD